MNSSTRLALILGLSLAAGAAFTACGGDDEPAGGGETPGNATLQLTYSPSYSAYVPGHEAQVPIVLKDPAQRGKGAKFTSKDPSIATVVDTDDGALVTVKKDGVVTITGVLGDESGSTKLTIKPYTEAQWLAGQERFSREKSAINPPNGGAVTAIALVNPAAKNDEGACNTCHTAQAKTLKIENTPAQIAGYSDEELITIFTMGKKPPGAIQKSEIPSFIWGMVHAWKVTEEEKTGLLAFLRTQTPKPNPAMIDYGVMPCPGQTGTGAMTMLCYNDGTPLPDPRRRDGGTPTVPPTGNTDAGTTTPTTPVDAGTTTTPDAGTPATGGDAG